MKRRRSEMIVMSIQSIAAITVCLFVALGLVPLYVLFLGIFLSTLIVCAGTVLIVSCLSSSEGFRAALATTVITLAISISAITTSWPLHITYTLSRGAFDSVASRVRSGERIVTPIRAGLFQIRRIEVSNHKVICLWTAVDPSGNTGFVQCPPGQVPFNLLSIVQLDDQWQFISED